jgi:SAM-dependent methyltransferase
MPNWLMKSSVHRVISWLPRSHYWNALLQQHVSRAFDIQLPQVEGKLAECHRFLNALNAQGGLRNGFVALELGTGWHPVFPIGLYLCGAKSVQTIDIDPMLSSERVHRAIELILQSAQRGELVRLLPFHQPDRLKALAALLPLASVERPAAVLARMGIEVVVADAQTVRLPDASVDFLTSCVVLEYIPEPVLARMLAEFHRVMRPGAVMAHRIDMADQFSFFDHTITRFNFLKFTARQWAFLKSPLIPLNRLRLSDYTRLFTRAGFVIRESVATLGQAEELRQVRLAPEFKHYDEADLLVLDAYIVSTREPRSSA